MAEKFNLETLASFAKRRGFVFPSSEIYGGFSAVYDYGHYGRLLKDNIVAAWWRFMLREQEDVVGLDSAIFMNPRAWEASGHVDGFNDPQIDCRECKSRYRADHVLEKFGIDADKASLEFINDELAKLISTKKLKCEKCGLANFTEAKVFSLMVKSNLGSPTDAITEDNIVYLRPETCGGIYLNYKNTLASTRVKVPFGIAQVGKAFRNEIVARQFIFRTREFEQMEMQYFHHPSETDEIFEKWKSARYEWYLRLGIRPESLRFHKHEKLAHYASAAYDIEYNFRSLGGFKEVEGVHARGNWDLSRHSEFSKEDLSYFDTERNEKFIPHIVETSVGLARLMLMVLDTSYEEEVLSDGESRTVLRFPKSLSPIKAAVFPLLKNKPELVDKAKAVFRDLRGSFEVEFDDNGNVGKRYRRQDEIGTPYCITIDFETLENDTVTLRDRDTMAQERVRIVDLKERILKEIS